MAKDYCDNCNEECQHQYGATCVLCKLEVLKCQDMGPYVQIGDSRFRDFICELCAERISIAWQASLKYHGKGAVSEKQSQKEGEE